MDRLSYTDAAAASYEQAMARISRHFVPLMLDAGHHLAAGHRLLDVATAPAWLPRPLWTSSG